MVHSVYGAVNNLPPEAENWRAPVHRKFIVAVAIVVLSTTALVAQVTDPARNPAPSNVVDAPNGTGTVQYDPGAPADGLLGQQGPSATVGNRFSSRNGNPLSTGSVSGLSFYVANASLAGGLAVLWGPPTGGGGAPAIGSFTVGTMASTGFHAVTFTAIPVGNDFLAGLYVNSGQPSRGQVGLRSASTNGQGFHGMQISFGGGAGANYASLAGQNSMFRASGTVIVPVELMEFDVD